METGANRLQLDNETPPIMPTRRHYNDESINLTDKRYWLEYHTQNNRKTLGTQYHLIPPTSISPEIAQARNLVPFREWTYLAQDEHSLHGPFNFATLNNQKTRDRIATTDWKLLIAARKEYDCPTASIPSSPRSYRDD
jgi:hypothetical protein